ncbi:hypothetical protein DOU02_06680 [Clavibacter michiganensis subsp. michiganensis]|nr:hypothetical protein [Clavibacter michiganensis]KAF0258763.1 hypothetical protein DOU02_06680 [Clavibacter michiganensis subsp. michiganensis]
MIEVEVHEDSATVRLPTTYRASKKELEQLTAVVDRTQAWLRGELS